MYVNLNPAQQAAVDAVKGDTVVISGPGSGKTRVLIQRYLTMISTHRIPQTDILNLTFTNAAATEMVERVGLFNAEQVFRTFHSFCLDMLKRERTQLPFKTVPTIIPVRGEQFMLMKHLLQVYRGLPDYAFLAGKISEWKRTNIEPEQALDESRSDRVLYLAAHAYEDYERKSREEGWLDFDSLVKESVRLLEKKDEVRARNQRKYIAVDECQDTDVVQFKLLQLIYSGNIFVVGDENQLIYEWRSAQPGNLSNFNRAFPGAKTLYLGQNYRSTPELVDYFKSILPVDNGLASHMVSERSSGPAPTFVQYRDEYQEVQGVLAEINDLENTAVLARTNKQLLRFQKECMRRNMKAEILGHKNLWQENEVKHLMDVAKDEGDMTRPAAEVLTDLIREHNMVHRYVGTGNPNDKDPVENLNDIVRMAGGTSKTTGGPKTLAEFLDWFRKITYMRKSKKDPILALSTVHQAKGREWKHVFVVGCKQGTMPHKDGELTEEARIFFVACSRAADTLAVSFYGSRSQFLNNVRERIEVYDEDL